MLCEWCSEELDDYRVLDENVYCDFCYRVLEGEKEKE